jgi:hypothetical protein
LPELVGRANVCRTGFAGRGMPLAVNAQRLALVSGRAFLRAFDESVALEAIARRCTPVAAIGDERDGRDAGGV